MYQIGPTEFLWASYANWVKALKKHDAKHKCKKQSYTMESADNMVTYLTMGFFCPSCQEVHCIDLPAIKQVKYNILLNTNSGRKELASRNLRDLFV